MSPLKGYSILLFNGIITLLITAVCSQEIGEASSVPTVHARVGETVLLPCHQELPTPAPPLPVALYLLQWQRTGSSYPFFIIFDSKSPFIDEQFEGRVSIPSEDDASLQITNVSIADAGSYECKVTELITGDVGSSENGTFANLVILYPPQLLATPPPSIVFPRGDPQSLQCQTGGVPTPVVKWYRQGQQVRNSWHVTVRGGSITFEGVRREDGGSYVCKAENSEGSVQDNTRVIVEGAPYIFVPPHDLTVLRGQTATFDCEYGASPSNVSQRWYYQDTLVQELARFAGRHSSLPTGGLSVDDVDVSDEGRYSCSPTNAIEVPPVAAGYLTVQYPASVVSMPSQVFAARSEPVTIPCHSDAKPAVLRYVWRKNQREIIVTPTGRYSVSGEGNLTILSTEYSDIGAYSCIPYNAVGTDGPSDAAILRVIEKPSFETRPRPTYERLPNETVTFPCTANGNPPPDVEWRKVQGPLPMPRSLVTSAGLTINNLTKEDTGAYECSITNEVATVTAVTYLYIQMTTPHSPHNVSVLTSSTSAYVMWYPGYNGGAEQKFTVRYKPTAMGTWSRYTDIPETVHSVLIRDLQPSTEYQFSLAGENSYGVSGWSEPILHETKGKNSNHTFEGVLDRDPVSTISPPRNLTVTPIKDSLLLSWLPPLEGAGLISHYAVEYWIEGPWLVLEDRVSGDLTELLLTRLIVNTTYSFRLIAFSGTGFSEPSAAVRADTWGLSLHKPATKPPSTFDLTGVLAGVIAGVFCLLCIILLACVVISCMQRRKRNKRMVFFSVVAHSDPGSPGTHSKPAEKRSICASLCCCSVGPEEKKHPSPGPNITVLPSSLVTMPRVSKTSIGGKAGVYHVSSSEVPDATLSGTIEVGPGSRKRQVSEGSEALEADEMMSRGRMGGYPEQPEDYSDGNGPREERHIRFQLTSTWGAPPKPDRGRIRSDPTSPNAANEDGNRRDTDPSTAVTVAYDDVTIECESPYSHNGGEHNNDQPSQDGDVEDNLIAYDEVPHETDSVFHPPTTVHYDDVPTEDLSYMAEELYASLRDEVPKRKFGVHEYALDDQSPDEDHHLGATDEDVVAELGHEYSKLERRHYPYSEMLHGGAVRLSGDSGMNSDNSGPSEENDPDTLKSSLRLADTVPSRHLRPTRPPLRSSNRSLPRASISPLSISTDQNPGQRNNRMPGSLPDFHSIDPRRDAHALSPHDSEYSTSSGYGSRNATVRPPSRNSGRFNNVPPPPSRTLPHPVDRQAGSGRSSASELGKYDPERERELMDALQRYYESDGDLRGSQRSKVMDLKAKEEKERRCAELKREFQEYRRERDSGAVSPRKTTIV